MKKRLISTLLAMLAGVGILASASACGVLGGGQPASAEVGECVDSTAIPEDNVTEIPVVDCTDAHDAQVIGKFELDDGDYPGQQAIDSEAQTGCLSAFEEFVGVTYEESTLDVTYVYPTQESWDQANDREILCLARTADGSTVTESWEGAAI